MRFFLAWVSVGVSAIALNGCFQVGDDDAAGGQGGESGDDGKTGGSSGSSGTGGNGATAGDASSSGTAGMGRAGRDTGVGFIGRGDKGGTDGAGGSGAKPSMGGTDSSGGSGAKGGSDGSGGSGGAGGSGRGGTGGGSSGGSGGSGGTGGTSGTGGPGPTPEGTCDGYAKRLEACALVAGTVECSELSHGVYATCFYGCIEEAPCGELHDGFCGGQASNALIDCVYACENLTFDCGGGATVPVDYECDGVTDCENGKDEADCASDTFACGDGSNVPVSYHCDGTADCDNGSDEDSCSTLTCTLPSAPTPGEACGKAGVQLKSCDLLPGGQMTGCRDRTELEACRTGCLAASACTDLEDYLCSGGSTAVNACLDDCREKSNQFPCKADNVMIPASWVCDDYTDCTDASDEVACTFTCGDATSVPLLYLCDDEDDCEDGSDEDGCTATCASARRSSAR